MSAGGGVSGRRAPSWRLAVLDVMLPYVMMGGCVVATVVVGWCLRLWTLDRPALVGAMSALVMASAIVANVMAWRLFKPHSTRGWGVGWGLAHHVMVSVSAGHIAVLWFMWFGNREFVWSSWIIGSLVVIGSWMLRDVARYSVTRWGGDGGFAQVGLPGSSFLPSGLDQSRGVTLEDLTDLEEPTRVMPVAES